MTNRVRFENTIFTIRVPPPEPGFIPATLYKILLNTPFRKLKVAFVACNRNGKRFREDPSFLYRCENLAKALDAAGHFATCRHISDLSRHEQIDVAVFHRPRMTMRFIFLVFFLKRRGVWLVADFDDLVFDPSRAIYNPGVLNDHVSLKSITRLYAAHKRALEQFDRITVSTEPLAREARSLFPHILVQILPNAVFRIWSQDDAFFKKKEKIITYFSGTRSHDRDFTLATPGVERFLDEHDEARLEVTGPVRLHLKAKAGQIIRRDKVSFDEYPRLFHKAWVNLAPLESTPFTQCKSALKVIEAGFWNIPTLCSDIADMRRFADAGALIMKTREDWFSHLTALADTKYYQKITENLSARMRKRADIDTIARQFVRFVTKQAKKGCR
jgi:glycosyltransferase involved in cell wall biosynthesis